MNLYEIDERLMNLYELSVDNETGEILRNYLMWCKSVK
jgi:hypothetical protein